MSFPTVLFFHSHILLLFLILNLLLASQLDLYFLRYGETMSALLSGLAVKPVCQFTDLCQITMPYVNIYFKTAPVLLMSMQKQSYHQENVTYSRK